MGRDMSRKTTETLTCETSLGKWTADMEEMKACCVTKLQKHRWKARSRLNGVNSGVHGRVSKDEAEEMSKVIFTVRFNIVKFGVPVPTSK